MLDKSPGDKAAERQEKKDKVDRIVKERRLRNLCVEFSGEQRKSGELEVKQRRDSSHWRIWELIVAAQVSPGILKIRHFME